MDTLFETDRLILRPTDLTDGAFLLELMNTPKWMQFIGDRNINTIGQAEQYITDKIITQHERLGYSNYTIIRKTDQNKLGTCGLYDREGLTGVDIGFAMLPDYEGQGYAFEAVNQLKALALSLFGLTTIQAITTKDNAASQRLLHKLGMSPSGTVILPGDIQELLLYSL